MPAGPKLCQALRDASKAGHVYLVVDGIRVVSVPAATGPEAAAPHLWLARMLAAPPLVADMITFVFVMVSAFFGHRHRQVLLKRDPCPHAKPRRYWGVALS